MWLNTRKTTVVVDPVEKAKQNVQSILSFFTDAVETINEAKPTLQSRHSLNNEEIDRLRVEIDGLESELDRYEKVTNKLGEFTSL